MSQNRRDFIKFVIAGSVAAGCPVDHNLLAAPAATVVPAGTAYPAGATGAGSAGRR